MSPDEQSLTPYNQAKESKAKFDNPAEFSFKERFQILIEDQEYFNKVTRQLETLLNNISNSENTLEKLLLKNGYDPDEITSIDWSDPKLSQAILNHFGFASKELEPTNSLDKIKRVLSPKSVTGNDHKGYISACDTRKLKNYNHMSRISLFLEVLANCPAWLVRSLQIANPGSSPQLFIVVGLLVSCGFVKISNQIHEEISIYEKPRKIEGLQKLKPLCALAVNICLRTAAIGSVLTSLATNEVNGLATEKVFLVVDPAQAEVFAIKNNPQTAKLLDFKVDATATELVAKYGLTNSENESQKLHKKLDGYTDAKEAFIRQELKDYLTKHGQEFFTEKEIQLMIEEIEKNDILKSSPLNKLKLYFDYVGEEVREGKYFDCFVIVSILAMYFTISGSCITILSKHTLNELEYYRDKDFQDKAREFNDLMVNFARGQYALELEQSTLITSFLNSDLGAELIKKTLRTPEIYRNFYPHVI